MSKLALRLIQKEKEKPTGILDLGRCDLTELPEELFELTHLKTLYLSYDRWNWKKRKWIQIQNKGRRNKLNQIPTSISKLIVLEELQIKRQNISDFSNLATCSSLKQLNLYNSQIEDIRFLEKLTSLQSLNLSDNQITSIRFLEKLTSLEFLDLSDNQITDIHFLEKLTSLQSLDLRSNQITDIRFLEKLTNLQSLYLSSNQITDIRFLLPLICLGKMQVSFKEYDFRNKINLYNNPIEKPPLEIIKRGSKAIINYYEQLEHQETSELYEAKMLIIGEGGAGKTSLARKLMDEKADLPEEEDTTKGIDIQEYYFQTAKDKEFRINIWDFGGQEIYHATHQFFLTKRSLYVLVDDTRKDDKSILDASFNYWLQTVELFGGDSPILIVQNEKGDRSKTLDLKSMQARFGNIKGKYATNLLTCSNLYKTKTALEFFIQQLPHIGQQLPKQWVAIRNTLEDMEKNGTYYLSLTDYFEVCRQHKIPEEKRALLLSQYLHDLGVFLHFQEDDLLNKVVILHNEWATAAVYKVLDSEFIKKAEGRFSRADLKKIWGDADCREKYKHMHGELLALMKKFEFCYPLNSKEKTFLAPQLFPEGQPNYVWETSDNLILRYQYGFMPKGLLSRLIVRLHHYIENLKTAWKNGVILKRNSTRAEVLNLYAQQEIRIRVKGKENKAFLDIIMEEFDKLHAQFEGIRVNKMIPCQCAICQTADWDDKQYFKYEDLKRAFYNNVNEVQCIKTFKMVSVHRLINATLIAQKIEDFQRNKLDDFRWKQEHRGAGDNVRGHKTINHNYALPSFQKVENFSIFDAEARRSTIEKSELKDLLADNEVVEILDILLDHAEDKILKQKVAELKTQWRNNKRSFRKKEIAHSIYDAKSSQLKKTLAKWILAW